MRTGVKIIFNYMNKLSTAFFSSSTIYADESFTPKLTNMRSL